MYLAYVSLMFDAVPPNFYVYAAGKGSSYLMLEIGLNLLLALLTDGVLTAARVSMLLGRFAAMGGRAAAAAKKLQRAEEALLAFQRYVKASLESCKDLRGLGEKLFKSRKRSVVARGKTKEEIHLRKEEIKRNVKCKCCGSTAHHSPRTAGNSVLVYR